MADDRERQPEPTPADDDPVARLIRERSERAARERPHVRRVYRELADELGRVPRLMELSAGLVERAGIRRTPRALSNDLDALGLRKYGRGRPPAAESRPHDDGVSDPPLACDLDAMSADELLALARRAIADNDQALLLRVMKRVDPLARYVARDDAP